MEKSLLALAVLGAFSGLVQAQTQTGVIIYGTFDGGVRDVKNVDAAGNSRVSISSNGTYFPNRFGFKGVEDLGGGLSARFNLETGFNTGTGALESTTGYFGSTTPSPFTGTGAFFQRISTVGMGSAWGGIDIGRQLSVSFKTMNLYDPFNFKYPAIIPISSAAAGDGVSQAGGGSRFQNDIQYTGKFGPFTARAEWALGEVAGAASTNSAQAVGFTYDNGPLLVGAAYTQKKIASTAGLASGAPAVAGPPAIAGTATATAASRAFDDKAFTAGATYTFDIVRISSGYNVENVGGAVGTTAVGGLTLTPSFNGADYRVRMAWFGAEYSLSPLVNITAAWYQSKYDTPTATTITSGKENLFIVGATHILSKRTTAYADIDFKKLNGNRVLGFGTTTTQDRVSGVSVGISHLF